MRSEVPFGVELTKLGGIDDDSPFRLTVDCYIQDADGSEIIRRYQVTGHDSSHDRTVREMEPFFPEGIAPQLDQLDHEHGRLVAPFARKLQLAQIELIHGEEGVKLIEEEEGPGQPTPAEAAAVLRRLFPRRQLELLRAGLFAQTPTAGLAAERPHIDRVLAEALSPGEPMPPEAPDDVA